MPSFLQLPGGLPWWLTLAILVPVALYLLLFLAMPFSVFGVKSRIDSIEARLDEIHEEIRGLMIRLPEMAALSRDVQDAARPPSIPPATPEPDLPRLQPDPAIARRAATGRPARSEPRLDWPK
jgi:hypothetical protein